MPALHLHKGPGVVMGVCPFCHHVFCRLGEVIGLCSLRYTVEVSMELEFSVRGHSVIIKQYESMFCINGSKSNPFRVGIGLSQSCPLLSVLFTIFMYRISLCCQGLEGVHSDSVRTPSPLFADDLVLSVSSCCDLQLDHLQI